ncbi:MAG TPA: BMP family ABC transporter substrate-binding protein, partial [Longilinea sp.]|nr:BMP family ABC transporter substrate-binding protein [Longilinea sp.]
TPTTVPVATPTTLSTTVPTLKPVVIGMLLVGPYNDQGWSQATYEGAKYVTSHLAGSQLIYTDKVNTSDRPGTTTIQVADDLVSRGADIIIFNSDDFKDDVFAFAQAHPDIPVIWLSGDYAWKDGQDYKSLPNEADIMGRIEYMKMIAGCAAALTTQTGKIGFLGPLINFETRRLAASAYLGAEYCWKNYRNETTPLQFQVNWIGFWFNIPGFTSDPNVVADDFYNSGFDVVISGIDTTEALTEAAKAQTEGRQVYAVSYDYKGGCDSNPQACLGVPYFNWGPSLLQQVTDIVSGVFQPSFTWAGPDWTNINNPDTSAVGFEKGQGLSASNSALLDKFIDELANGLDLWTGPLNLQDGTQYVADGVAATNVQIWYLPQLLEGMEGQSVPK